MAQIATNTPPVEPRRRPSPASILMPPLIFLGMMFMAAGFAPISLHPLKVLQIAYPGWMDYSHFLIPGACALLWLMSLRKWPNAGAIVAVLLCSVLLPLVPRYCESRVAKLPVTRWIELNDLNSMESRLGVRVVEQGSREGMFVIVAPGNEQRVRAELARLQLLGGSAAE
jgi:hypothetical protein